MAYNGCMGRRETQYCSGRYTVTLRSGLFRLKAEVRGVETPLLFSINKRHFAFLLEIPLDAPVGFRGLIAYRREMDDPGPAAQWLAAADNAALIDALDMARKEALLVCGNAVGFLGSVKRDRQQMIDTLFAIADRLPRPAPPDDGVPRVDGLPFDAAQLPIDLRPLADQVVWWSVGDDEARARRLNDASSDERRDLVRVVSPLLPRINDYLDSFGDAALSNEAVLVGNLAEAAAELGA